MSRSKRKEIPVRYNPGISKELRFDEASGKWKETGRYRALRRVIEDGCSKKEQAIFSNLEDARTFRSGKLEKAAGGRDVHLLSAQANQVTLGGLIEEWKPFHYLTIEFSTRQTYDKLLPSLEYLKSYPVEAINVTLIDKLIAHWVNEDAKKSRRRQTFHAELALFKTVLNFYRKRKNPSFANPILEEHYRACDITKKAKQSVQSLSQEELGIFLEELKTGGRAPKYFPIALAQFCLGLRIGEACALMWSAIDLENRIVQIDKTIIWDLWTWGATVKEKPKNGKTRTLVMPEILVGILWELRKTRDPDVDLVFHKNGIPLNRKTIQCAYNRALKRRGIHHVTGTHMMRKTAATQANEVTGDFYAVSKLLDHSSPAITLKYVAQTDSSKHKVAEALNQVATRAVGGHKKGSSPRLVIAKKDRLTAAVPQCPAPSESRKLFLVKSVS